MVRINQQKATQTIYLTADGLNQAKVELTLLKTIKRAEISQRIQNAREFGDTNENSEYDAALEEQASVENRIVYLESVLKDAKIISKDYQNGYVTIGSTVMVEIDGAISEFTIVGKIEANPSKKLISNESPLGTSILGLKVGESAQVSTPSYTYSCKVLKIR